MNKTPNTETKSTAEYKTEERDRLINGHIGLAYKFALGLRNRGLPLEDLRQEALLGLLEAAERFEPERGLNFSTYACHWIRKRLFSALGKESKATQGTEPLGDRDLIAPERSGTRTSGAEAMVFPSSMPAAEREVMLLSMNEGLALKEVATRMGISVERVKQLRGKALRRLRRDRDATEKPLDPLSKPKS